MWSADVLQVMPKSSENDENAVFCCDASEVAKRLRELFYVFGPPRLLHSDNGREFVADVIQDLKVLFPGMYFVRGRRRHPQSQGCVERANGVLTAALGKWLTTTKSLNWSEGLAPVVYGINTRVASATKCTPHEVMFGQKPRCDQEFWKIVQESNIVDEEQLSTPVDDIIDNTVLDDGLVTTDSAMNSTMTIDNEAFPLYDNTTADDVNSPSLLDQSSTSVCAAPVLNPLSSASVSSSNDNLISFDSPKSPAKTIEPNSKSNSCVNILDELDALVNSPVKTTSLSSLSLSTVVVASSNTIENSNFVPAFISPPFNSLPSVVQSPRHKSVRKQATENYLATANKKRKLYEEHLQNLAETLNVGDCVGINIHDVDRTNTDPKLLPCLIFSKEKKEDSVVFQLACQFGKLVSSFTAESLVSLKAVCPSELKSVDPAELKSITLIEACKLFVRGSVSGATCDCKSQCATKHCSCKKANVNCSTKCHSKRSAGCKNME
ncbi:unnamed protein product [Didymodactylos carnosus]|uniref:Integrase catalytic domain-containing protein n=1 Tax=Didymodactylos carnosus TaxID=1234261 RepID=A0A814JDY4_9BILA|nr:unnamed protein product [Didymodactylos carnosus]CAF3807284.1 unnamed protein product [Didymodactylos carnosus]